MYIGPSPGQTTTFRFPPINKCIYCGATGRGLTDEHIIPYALAGVLVLPAASCVACQKIIHKYETTCCRNIMGDFRIRYGFPTRRKSERPRHIDIVNRRGEKIRVSRSEFPAPLFMYRFGEANILQGLPPDSERFEWIPHISADSKELDAFIKKYDWEPAHVIKLQPVPFARMLAKIGYSYAIAILVLDAFTPLALDAILCRTEKVAYIVGGQTEVSPAVRDGKHLLGISYIGNAQKPSPGARALVCTHIRLMSAAQTPTYCVVVGEVDFSNSNHVEIFQKNISVSSEVSEWF